MTSRSQEIADLKRRIADLEAAENGGQNIPEMNAAATKPVEPDGLRIFTTGDRAPVWVLPSEDDLAALKAIVLSAYPGLAPRPGRFSQLDVDEFDRGFAIAMKWLAVQGRGPLDTKHYLSWWTDQAGQWAVSTNLVRSISEGPTGAALLAAVLAWGDVDFVMPLGSQLGLRPYGWRDAPVEAGWRSVLTSGRLRDPIVSKPLSSMHPTPVRIDGQVELFHTSLW